MLYLLFQALAFLALVAESYGVWGPFLVITPASTLHNWQQEVARFLPAFTTVPYWGSPQERKVLRSFWNQENLHTKVRNGIVFSRVVDPDSVTLWIRIRIGIPDPGARKLRNFCGKMHFLVILNKILPLKRYKIALTTF
jgi:hypothetical protein